MEPTFIDFEASSLSLIESYPIEVGLCPPDGKPVGWLIKPHILWYDWSEKSEQVHQITRQLLNEEGTHLKHVASALNEKIDGIVYCDAWTFDLFWLHRLFKAAKLQPAFRLESIANLLTEDQVVLWQSARKSVIREFDINTHRAANDAWILHLTWKAIQN
ncbi:MAG: hypothetical protein CSA52_02765 [Gammaproteobacteria bacterium]|nr:MAG: hypothetical protein CSB48_04435 [Pseudomonadota bacterium]PIE38322.1 MAG: hypothetical protein CSA52_02765 [Gammaproteobacteria bacterium]